MDMKAKIIPIPREYTAFRSAPVILGVPGRGDFTIVNETEPASSAVLCSADRLLRDTLDRLLNIRSDASRGKVTVTLRMGEAPEGIPNAEQGYTIEINDHAVAVTGFGEAGLFYGVVTLTQCMTVENGRITLEACRITDWPDLRTRGHFMESRFGSNLMTLEDWKAVVDHIAGMKQNQLVVSVYGCWCVQYDGRVSEYLYLPIQKYPQLKVPVVKRYWSPKKNGWVDEEVEVPMAKEDFFGDLIAYGKTKAVEVLPLFNSYGHNTLIPRMFPEIASKFEDGESTLTGFCTRNPKTYEILFDIYDEIIDRYLKPNGIESFHIGCDEVWEGIAQNADDIYRNRNNFCKCPLCRSTPKDDLYIEHVIRLMKHLKDRGMRNIYMYHDMLLGHGIGTEFDSTEKMRKAIEDNGLKDIAVIDWWTYSDYQEGLMFQSTRPELGLRRTVKPWNGYYHWNIVSYPLKNVSLLAKMARAEGVEGMQSYSAWDRSFDRVHVAQADYSWCFDNCGSPDDITEAYASARFGAQYEKALRALRIQDRMMSTLPAGGDGTAVPSNYTLLMNVLCYYFYSYVRSGKPYPRSFPGEAMQTILERREEYESAMTALNAMAVEDERLWREVASDARTDASMARRYAWEAAHIKVLTGDFLALLRMYDLYEKSPAGNAGKMADIAGERKLARLELMDEFERTKEEFLAPSHLRNHSIYMQFFADLEAYLRNTAPEDISLDFTDFGKIGSEAFRKLR